MRPPPIPKTALVGWRGALVLATLSVLAAAARAHPEATAPTLTVLFTGDTRGVVEPCACRGEMRGGLARRATLLRGKEEEVRGSKGRGCLIVDNGNLLGRDVDALRAPVLAQALQRMGYAVVNVAPEDAKGEGFLQAAQEAGLRLVSGQRVQGSGFSLSGSPASTASVSALWASMQTDLPLPLFIKEGRWGE